MDSVNFYNCPHLVSEIKSLQARRQLIYFMHCTFKQCFYRLFHFWRGFLRSKNGALQSYRRRTAWNEMVLHVPLSVFVTFLFPSGLIPLTTVFVKHADHLITMI